MRAGLMCLGAVFALTACGGGGDSGSSPASSQPSSSGSGSSTGAGAPTLSQFVTYQTVDAADEGNSTIQFKSPTVAGDTLWVVVTVSDFAGTHSITLSDTQGNEFIALDQENDGAPATQSLAHFYAANIAGDASTPDTITVHWGSDNYKGIMAADISGASHTPLIAHTANTQDGLAKGTANVTSTGMSVPTNDVPALLVALSMNASGGTSDTGGSGAAGATASTGFTQVAQFWNWGANLGTLSTKVVSTAGDVSANFDAPDTDSYVTVAAVFK